MCYIVKESFFKPKIDYQERYHQETLLKTWRKGEALSLLLDNSLITPCNKKRVDMKLIDCGDYKQVYYLSKMTLKKDDRVEKFKDLNKICISTIGTSTKKRESKNELKKIELKNILRSRFEMQRLVKTNEKIFKTFITLTFADNITDIKEANKKFDIWRTNVKSLYKDFAYLCVPEFQKRGAVHYHLLTNLDIKQNPLIIIPQKGKKSQYDVKYWSYGFSSVFDMKDINVVGYISKYMTKDVDNRLWGHRRYFYSQNLKKPETIELDLSNPEHWKIYLELLTDDYKLEYSKEYTDFLQNDIIYEEYKLSNTN